LYEWLYVYFGLKFIENQEKNGLRKEKLRWS